MQPKPRRLRADKHGLSAAEYLLGGMERKCITSVRAYLGGIALGIGGIGLFVFMMAIPITYLAMELVCTGFPLAPGRTPAQVESDVQREFWSVVWHKLSPLFVTSLLLIGYGVFEAVKEQQSNHDHAA